MRALGQVFVDADMVKDDNGAKCVWVPNPKEPNAPEKPLIVQKSDGGFTYATTDLAALKYRIEETQADWIFYVVDSGQASHLECVYEAGRQVRLREKISGWV